MAERKVIELRMPLEPISGDAAVLPSEQNGPTVIQIVPTEVFFEVDGKVERRLDFRVAFEPQNFDRRKQPYRNALDRNAFITDTEGSSS